jgi:predicted amidohydrolase YtcJ
MGAHADLLITGRIATLGGDSGLGWVEALAVGDGRVLAGGTRADLDGLVTPGTRRIELAPDEAAMPALTDAHLHFAEASLNVERVDLTADASPEAGLARIAAAHRRLPPRAWLLGHGWESDRWGGWPTAGELERVAPGRLAAIWAHDHHSLWVSHAALGRVPIDWETPDPPGGLIRRDPDGHPTGILHEAAARLVTSHVPAPTAVEFERAMPRLAHDLLALGVVAVHDPGALAIQGGLGPVFEAYGRLADRDGLGVRIHACIRQEQVDAAADAGLRSGSPIGDERGGVRFGWLKLFADGTLGSRTAALLEPIELEPDRPLPPGTERGVWMTEPDELVALAAGAASLGISTTIHAIGDAAVRASLDALEPTVGRAAFMPRLEHVQLAHPDDVPRFAAAGIAASVQPVHLRSDAVAARRLWGARAERNGYAWATLERAGALVAFGTDAPVEPIDPWPGLEIAATRVHASWGAGAQPFGPQEALPLDRILRAAAVHAAMTAREDRGRLVPGAPADLIVVPAAALAEPVEAGGALGTARPRLVVVGGRTVVEA